MTLPMAKAIAPVDKASQYVEDVTTRTCEEGATLFAIAPGTDYSLFQNYFSIFGFFNFFYFIA